MTAENFELLLPLHLDVGSERLVGVPEDEEGGRGPVAGLLRMVFCV